MLKRIKNNKETKKESLNYNQLMDLIKSIDKKTNIDFDIEYINYYPENQSRYFRGVKPDFISRFVSKNFNPSSREEYFNASYEVIFSKNKEEHYLELEEGKKETEKIKIGKKRKAYLEWIVNKGD
ncbi:MAG TPA: hypothetical protein VJ912_03090 [Candidatus Nanoarchaeia archaeon]|nr:hypothetical protein [Candidatus Nanoarchaeia archaeon]